MSSILLPLYMYVVVLSYQSFKTPSQFDALVLERQIDLGTNTDSVSLADLKRRRQFYQLSRKYINVAALPITIEIHTFET